jgi:hypothetical protein
MANKPDSIVLEHLRRFDARQGRFEDALRDMSARLSIKARLDRIERRLDLVDAD